MGFHVSGSFCQSHSTEAVEGGGWRLEGAVVFETDMRPNHFSAHMLHPLWEYYLHQGLKAIRMLVHLTKKTEKDCNEARDQYIL